MEWYNMEQFERMGDAMEEIAQDANDIPEGVSQEEWDDFVADMATNPYDDPFLA